LGTEKARSAKAGALMTALSFLMWGLLTIYWKALVHVSPSEVLAHRIIWSFLFTVLLLISQRRFSEMRDGLRSRADWIRVGLSSLCLGANWYAFVWAIAHNRVLECSLGYYINPLVSVVLGGVFLGERLRRWQLLAALLSVIAVTNLLISHGEVPWAGLVLAFTFGAYGLLRKTSHLESLPGLTSETALLTIPAVAFLFYLNRDGRCALGGLTWNTNLLLVGAGVVTALPLLCFSYGARRIRLATVGFLQYLAPSCMFLLGLLVYNEPFDRRKLMTFVLIWVALGIYSWDSIRSTKDAPCGD
jgi:chloramphenicol-sensitive protein RarD